MRGNSGDRMPQMSQEDLARIRDALRSMADPNVNWGARDTLDVWLAETRLAAERAATKRVLVATWALVVVTLALVVATVGLIIAAS